MPGFRHRVRQTGPVSERVWIGVDVGGTKVLAAAVVDEPGRMRPHGATVDARPPGRGDAWSRTR